MGRYPVHSGELRGVWSLTHSWTLLHTPLWLSLEGCCSQQPSGYRGWIVLEGDVLQCLAPAFLTVWLQGS